jgi:hypothetical protein
MLLGMALLSALMSASAMQAQAQFSIRAASASPGQLQPHPSPDGTHTLYGLLGKEAGTQLWIKDNSTGASKLLLTSGGTMQAFWSTDGKAFSVNDHWASDRESAYIYDTETFKRQNVGEDILAADPKSRRFTNAHPYFQVERWDGPAHVFIRFHGHTDEAPVQCFDFQYRVSRSGVVEKLSARVYAVDQNGCN